MLTASVLFPKNRNHILKIDNKDNVGQLVHEEDYSKLQYKELSKNIGILAKWGRSQRHRFTQKDEDDMNRLRECP